MMLFSYAPNNPVSSCAAEHLTKYILVLGKVTDRFSCFLCKTLTTMGNRKKSFYER